MTELEMKLVYGLEGFEEVMDDIEDFLISYDSYEQELLEIEQKSDL